MTKRKLRKNADISPPQSPHDGIHTCSRGCNKPGCTRTLRDTIEEQDKQIEALKRDVLEKTAGLRKSEEHNEALCERMQDLSGELHTASCANANAHKKNARLKAEVERLKAENEAVKLGNKEWRKTAIERGEMNAEDANAIGLLKAQVERLTKAGDAMLSEWASGDEKDAQNFLKALVIWNAAKEVQS